MTAVDAFRYRAEDALRSVTHLAIRDARVKEIKQEIFASEALRAHFEDNPKDLEALKHDRPLAPQNIQSHMKHVPYYLLPRNESAAPQDVGKVYFDYSRQNSKGGKKRSMRSKGGSKKRKIDALKSFKV